MGGIDPELRMWLQTMVSCCARIALLGLALLVATAYLHGHAGAIAQARFLTIGATQSSAPAAPASPALQYRALLDRYCVTCHNDRLKTANLTLERTDLLRPEIGRASCRERV